MIQQITNYPEDDGSNYHPNATYVIPTQSGSDDRKDDGKANRQHDHTHCDFSNQWILIEYKWLFDFGISFKPDEGKCDE